MYPVYEDNFWEVGIRIHDFNSSIEHFSFIKFIHQFIQITIYLK